MFREKLMILSNIYSRNTLQELKIKLDEKIKLYNSLKTQNLTNPEIKQKINNIILIFCIKAYYWLIYIFILNILLLISLIY